MGIDYYQDGYFAGWRNQCGRPPYDPHDPRTMINVRQFQDGYEAGTKAKNRDLCLKQQLNQMIQLRKQPKIPF